jgi:hypothetical protein
VTLAVLAVTVTFCEAEFPTVTLPKTSDVGEGESDPTAAVADPVS